MKTDTTDTLAPADGSASTPAAQPRKRCMARESKASGQQTAEHQSDSLTEDKVVSDPKDARGPTKISAVIALLKRSAGATLAEMIDATRWLPHTTRAALTGLKKKGHVIAKDKRDDVTCYRITKAAQ